MDLLYDEVFWETGQQKQSWPSGCFLCSQPEGVTFSVEEK